MEYGGCWDWCYDLLRFRKHAPTDSEVAAAFEEAHRLGMFTILWCYTRNGSFKVDGVDYHTSADLTGQANHIGVTIRADIIKQKMPTNNGGFKAVGQRENTS